MHNGATKKNAHPYAGHNSRVSVVVCRLQNNKYKQIHTVTR